MTNHKPTHGIWVHPDNNTIQLAMCNEEVVAMRFYMNSSPAWIPYAELYESEKVGIYRATVTLSKIQDGRVTNICPYYNTVKGAILNQLIMLARITPLPKKFGDPMPKVIVTCADDMEHELFQYYPDELSFTVDEFIGLTLYEGRELKQCKDLTYLRS